MSEFQFSSQQDADPLADAKAWLATMEKTLAKLAAEHVGQCENAISTDCARLPANAPLTEATRRSPTIVAN